MLAFQKDQGNRFDVLFLLVVLVVGDVRVNGRLCCNRTRWWLSPWLMDHDLLERQRVAIKNLSKMAANVVDLGSDQALMRL